MSSNIKWMNIHLSSRLMVLQEATLSLCFTQYPKGKHARTEATLSSSLYPPCKSARSEASISIIDDTLLYNHTPKMNKGVVQEATLKGIDL
jgi:hypothetical protein